MSSFLLNHKFILNGISEITKIGEGIIKSIQNGFGGLLGNNFTWTELLNLVGFVGGVMFLGFVALNVCLLQEAWCHQHLHSDISVSVVSAALDYAEDQSPYYFLVLTGLEGSHTFYIWERILCGEVLLLLDKHLSWKPGLLQKQHINHHKWVQLAKIHVLFSSFYMLNSSLKEKPFQFGIFSLIWIVSK